jgi:methyl-accepting chemotaxis protein
VRELSEQSAGVTVEIERLAADSRDVAERASGQLGALVPVIERTATLAQTVAEASREQSTGVEEVGRAMLHVDTLTQQNAAAAHELAATAGELAAQAETLRTLVATFRVAEDVAIARQVRSSRGGAHATR